MMSLLFDAPYWFLILLTLAGLIVTYLGMSRQKVNLRTGGLAAIGVAVLLLVLRFTVETPEKQVEKQTRALIEAVSRNDWPGAGVYMNSAHLADTTVSGADLVKYGEEMTRIYGLKDVKITSIDVQRRPNIIAATISVVSHHTQTYVDTVPSTWRFEYQKGPRGWVLSEIVAVKIGFGDTGDPKQFFPRLK